MEEQIQKISSDQGNHGKPAANRRILVVIHRTLLSEGVVSLLKQKPDIDLWGIEKDNDKVIETAASQLRPDVLLLFDLGPGEQKRQVHLLRSIPTFQKLKVIIAHSNTNTLDVYYQNNWFQVNNDAFFPLIYGRNLDVPVNIDLDESPVESKKAIKPGIVLTQFLGVRRLFPV